MLKKLTLREAGTEQREFEPVTEPIYKFNKKFNSCWVEKLAAED